MKTKANQVAIPILFTVLFLLFPIFSSPDFPDIKRIIHNPDGLREILTQLLLAGFFYLSYFVLIPRFYFRQKYIAFYASVTLAAFTIFLFLLLFLGSDTWQHRGKRQDAPPLSIDTTNIRNTWERPPPMRHVNILRIIFLDYSLYLFLIVLFLSLLLKSNQRWRKLQQEKLETELSYLKAQINPHFLFNTLNSIYALAIEKSDYTPTAVVKLSGMMRYIISESGKNFVSLEKEVNYISDYVELQKFRLGDTVRIRYTPPENNAGKLIAPLILITFVENAFKYGVNPEECSEISIHISIVQDLLVLKVENNKVTTRGNNAENSGLGIDNTCNRLELQYPGKYRLSIEDGQEQFKVHLEISL